jgi:hypothetical protein
MSALSEVVGALNAAGLGAKVEGASIRQGMTLTISAYPRPLRVYAWQVSDNGRATGTVRPADERRIQAIATDKSLIEASADPETVVLGWAGEFAQAPVLVAFNPYSVANRVNRKIMQKMADGASEARASDSQQFRQPLLDEAAQGGIAIGQNQHGDHVVPFVAARFLDYLHELKPKLHTDASHAGAEPQPASMESLVADAQEEIAGAESDTPPSPPDSFDPASIEDGRERLAREIAVRRGQPKFRACLISSYGICAVTGCNVEAALEAAHIVPYQGEATNHPANGLLLRADIHTLFDLGLLAVDPDKLEILLSAELDGTEYENLRGQALKLGKASISPSKAALAKHRSTSKI